MAVMQYNGDGAKSGYEIVVSTISQRDHPR